VEIVGEFQTINQVVTDGSGGFHMTFTWNIHGTGTGSFGNTYRYNHTSPERFNVGADDLPYTHSGRPGDRDQQRERPELSLALHHSHDDQQQWRCDGRHV
jgi:hypothetical protein